MPEGDLETPEPDAPDAEAPDHDASHADPPPDDGPRQRLVAGLLKPSKRQLVAGVLLAVLGFAAVTQVHANRTDDTFSGQREQELIDILSALAGTRQRAEDEIADLERVRDQLQDDTSKRRAALEQAQQDVDELNVLAGLVPVTGPGIRVTIQEETGRVTLSSLLDTIEELRTAQAEAMQINGTVHVDQLGSIDIESVAEPEDPDFADPDAG